MIGLRTVGAVGKERTYISIDLKSFYASVECIERGLNPMTTNLMVADESRTEKTICLAVSPSLKSYGIPGRPRLFEVVQKIKEVNQARKRKASGRRLIGSSYVFEELNRNPTLEVGYIIAPPRMAYYMEYSTRIYDVYLKYVAPEDIQVYSIDEVFIDATHYLYSCNMTAKAFAQTIIKDVLQTTGITATAGIGTNLYLCKIVHVAEHKIDNTGNLVLAERLVEYNFIKTVEEFRSELRFKQFVDLVFCFFGNLAFIVDTVKDIR